MDLINATGCDAEILSPAKTSERIKTTLNTYRYARRRVIRDDATQMACRRYYRPALTLLYSRRFFRRVHGQRRRISSQ